MSVIIKMSFGKVGSDQEFDTDLTPEEWNAMTEKERIEMYSEAVWQYADCCPVDSENPETVLA